MARISELESLRRAEQWHRQARSLSAKLNFHHWLARFIPLLLAVLVPLSLFEIFRREMALPARWTLALLLAGSALAAVAAWVRGRGHFCTPEQGLVRLETVLGLHNELSAARASVVDWPLVPANATDGYVPNWRALSIPMLAGAFFLGLAHIIPVHRAATAGFAGEISEPPEFAQVQAWINALKAEDLIDANKLQETQTALDSLRQRAPQDWYTQGNLEAADSLKQLTEQSMNSLARNLDQADSAVQALRTKEETTKDPNSLQPMEEALREAGENLVSGNLPLKRELVSPMLGGENARDKPLTAAQLQALHERLKKGALAARTASKSNGGLSEEMQQAMAYAAQGKGSGRRESRPGGGGVGGGEKTAPLELQARDKTTPDGGVTPVNNDDMTRASLGETIKVTAGAHSIDSSQYPGAENAGTAQVQGTGGEAVWRSTYDPSEADALSRFFK